MTVPGNENQEHRPAAEPTASLGSELSLMDMYTHLRLNLPLAVKVTVLGALLGAVVAVLIGDTRLRAEASARPVGGEALAILSGPEFTTLTPNEALSLVIFEARSQANQQQVIERHILQMRDSRKPDGDLTALERETVLQILEATDISVRAEQFVNAATTNGLPNAEGLLASQPKIFIRVAHEDAEVSAELSNTLLETSHNIAKSAFVEEQKSKLRARLEFLQARLRALQNTAQQSLADEIVRIQEADDIERLQLQQRLELLAEKARRKYADAIEKLEVAIEITEAGGIEAPVLLPSYEGQPDDTDFAASYNAPTGFQQYWKGSKVLRAELAALKSRLSPEQLVPEIDELRSQLAALEKNPRIEILKKRENWLSFVPELEGVRLEVLKLESLLQRDFQDLQLMQVEALASPITAESAAARLKIIILSILAAATLGVILAIAKGMHAQQRNQN